MTTTKRHYSTAGKPRTPADAESLSAYLPDDTTDNPGLAMGLQAAIGRVAALQAEYEILAAENHATRNEMQVWQLKAHALRTALADLVGAINAIPYNYIAAHYLERIEPEMARAVEVLAACETIELAKEQ